MSEETDGIDFDVVALHVGILKGYLLAQCAPHEVMESFKFVKSQFVAVTDAERFNAKFAKLEAAADRIKLPPTSKKWDDGQRDDIWGKHTQGKTPKDIAKGYPGRNAKSISNLIEEMRESRESA